jgi:spore coat polysaccharide biosynthesis protein SpsF
MTGSVPSQSINPFFQENEMKPFSTEQEKFWAGEFGNDYIARNQGAALLASNLDFFSKAFKNTRDVNSCLEFGANIGMNLKALQLLYPQQEQHAIEINAEAAKLLGQVIPPENVYATSILDFQPSRVWDLVLIKGVLIHMNPEKLPEVYDKLVAASGRYLLVAEYYNPAPVAIPYRGHSDRLFKRDFAGEIMDRHPEMQLVDYGFAYRRDPNFPQDDITWFLMEKRTG